ncbi:archease [bacterium]|nr:archease [bacterium]
MNKKFESLSHTADIKVRVYGKTKKELFCNALYAMFQVIEPRAESCKKINNHLACADLPEHHVVAVRAGKLDLLLVDFLSEALYLSDVYHQAYFDAAIDKFDDNYISATIKGVNVQGFNVEIKAVTYHELEIKQVDGKWQAIIVFDI